MNALHFLLILHIPWQFPVANRGVLSAEITHDDDSIVLFGACEKED